ncbi:unconventional myosin-XIX [Carlito syrichta]|uniref:Unconventional myosin-XIX n=1 Tax=Carlito syrichta TaxID=1868482 RepID=A0A3Q0DZZ6_CARSF|nr:unconventional myosin-XIX [Carlito syrichta]
MIHGGREPGGRGNHCREIAVQWKVTLTSRWGCSGREGITYSRVLAGLLHLGNIQFSDSEDEAQPCQLLDNAKCAVRTAALLLQLPEDMLLETLHIRTIRAGRQQQVFRKPCSRAECDTRRDCLAKLVYAWVFDWLVSVINSSICAEPDSWTTFIGLLDVYGFESFPDNSLEQLCINYANEKLQQHFVAHYLRAQQEEYTVEGLEWSFVNYQDNQTCLDLIEGSPISICSLINEECRLNRPSSAAQLQMRIESALADSPCLGHNKLSREPSFIVVHYAGPVRYHTAGLVEKNKDPVPPELKLDDVEDKHFSHAPHSLSSSPPQTRLLRAIIHLWPLGLVLANAAVGVRGFQRKLVVWACLQLARGSPSSNTVQTAQQDQAGVKSIRALPQGSVKFHCRKSPLRYADICPEPSPYSVTGFNQILLERQRPVHV